jgi:hypothetical protein
VFNAGKYPHGREANNDLYLTHCLVAAPGYTAFDAARFVRLILDVCMFCGFAMIV